VTVHCRLVVVPDGDMLEYVGGDGSTYEDALKQFGINPDTVLIISDKNKSIPQDAPIREKRVDIVLTCSRG
jgi:sulfur carrier protein ThiS